MKKVQLIILLIIITLAIAITVSGELRGQLGLMSHQERVHRTINNGDIGQPLIQDVPIVNLSGQAVQLSEMTNQPVNLLLAGASCPGCKLMVNDFIEQQTPSSPRLIVLYFNELPSNLKPNQKVTYLKASGNRHFGYFDSPFTPTVYQVNSQGIVTHKHIGYSDETLAYLLSQPNA